MYLYIPNINEPVTYNLYIYLTNPTHLYMCVNDIHDVVNDFHVLTEPNLQCDEQSFHLIYLKLTFVYEY